MLYRYKCFFTTGMFYIGGAGKKKALREIFKVKETNRDSDSDSDSEDSEDELEFEFYDDMSKIRKFEKQAKAGTITGKQAEEKCKKLILAMPKKYRTLTDRKIKSTIKDLLASI